MVFSDDTEWVKRHWSHDGPYTIVDHNGAEAPEEDLRLMSLCRHHIIANSTFSWWGAWLSDSINKIVISPDRWFDHGQLDMGDLLPENWLKLPLHENAGTKR
jgi:hypothetical protein